MGNRMEVAFRVPFFQYSIANFNNALDVLGEASSYIENLLDKDEVNEPIRILEEALNLGVFGYKDECDKNNVYNDEDATFEMINIDILVMDIEEGAEHIRKYLDDDRPGYAYQVMQDIIKCFDIRS